MDTNKETILEKDQWQAMYRRWIYMAIAILAAALMPLKPAFSFQEDKGIIYMRSFSMDEKLFSVTQTELSTGAKEVTATMSVKGLYYCQQIMLWGSVLCLLCFYSRWRVALCTLIAISCGVYYIFIIVYAMRMTDLHYATLYPTFTVFLPAIVLQCMIMTRHNVIQSEINAREGDA